MNPTPYSYVHFFDTLRDTVTAKPYAILSSEEVNSLIDQIETLVKAVCEQGDVFESVSAFRQAILNARYDGYFPIVILPVYKYQVVMSHLRTVS
jgi:hypothetical protein